MYHGIIDDDNEIDCWWLIKRSQFFEQIEYIRRNFSIISIDEALGNKRLPKNPCVLTFDDGYKSFLTHAYPILEEYQIPSTIYITTGPVAEEGMIWTDRIFCYLYNKYCEEIDLTEFSLGKWPIDSKINKRKSLATILYIMKKTDYRKKNTLIEKIIKQHKDSSRFSEAFKNPFETLSIDDVKELSEKPLVTIGAHTVNHEVLTRMPVREAAKEIKDSRDFLKKWTGKAICHFSYPDGQFNYEIAKQVRKLGFKSAARIGLNINWKIRPYQLYRVGTGSWDNDIIFKCMVNGIIPLKVALIQLSKK